MPQEKISLNLLKPEKPSGNAIFTYESVGSAVIHEPQDQFDCQFPVPGDMMKCP